MNITISETPRELGEKAAALTARILNEAIKARGNARLVLSTGASQFETVEALGGMDVDWSAVEVFHLDEYIGMSEEHPASFRRYIRERFAEKVNLKAVHYVNGEGDIKANISALTAEIKKAPIDAALIGIGENAHIAFNDPPADFEIQDSYIVVDLDEKCRMQQLGEGWFASLEDVPRQAISMTVSEILRSRAIISAVPHSVKAEAIKKTVESDTITPMIPATALKKHPNWELFLDESSGGQLTADN